MEIAVKSASLSSRYKDELHIIFNPFSAYLESTKDDYLKSTKALLKTIEKNRTFIIISAVD